MPGFDYFKNGPVTPSRTPARPNPSTTSPTPPRVNDAAARPRATPPAKPQPRPTAVASPTPLSQSPPVFTPSSLKDVQEAVLRARLDSLKSSSGTPAPKKEPSPPRVNIPLPSATRPVANTPPTPTTTVASNPAPGIPAPKKEPSAVPLPSAIRPVAKTPTTPTTTVASNPGPRPKDSLPLKEGGMGGTAQTLRRGPRAEPPRAENSMQTRLLCILGALIALVVAYLMMQ